MGKVIPNESRTVEAFQSWEPPFLRCSSDQFWCYPGATGIEIIENGHFYLPKPEIVEVIDAATGDIYKYPGLLIIIPTIKVQEISLTGHGFIFFT